MKIKNEFLVFINIDGLNEAAVDLSKPRAFWSRENVLHNYNSNEMRDPSTEVISTSVSSRRRWSQVVQSWAPTGQMWAREKWRWAHRTTWSSRSTEHLFLFSLFDIMFLRLFSILQSLRSPCPPPSSFSTTLRWVVAFLSSLNIGSIMAFILQ